MSVEKDTVNGTTTGPTSKLAALRARKDARDTAKKAELEALEVEALELEEKFTDAGGESGTDFLVVTTTVGNFVVKNPDFMVAKKFLDSDDRGVEAIIQFVAPCVAHPEQMTVRAVFQAHAGVAGRLATAAIRLYQAEVSTKAGK